MSHHLSPYQGGYMIERAPSHQQTTKYPKRIIRCRIIGYTQVIVYTEKAYTNKGYNLLIDQKPNQKNGG